MAHDLRQRLQSRILYLIWLLIHTAYHLRSEISGYLRFTYNYVKARLLSLLPLYSQERQFATFVESVSKLPRVPKHLAISVIPDCKNTVLSALFQKLCFLGNPNSSSPAPNDKVGLMETEMKGEDLQSLASLIAWASAASIRVISLYDYHGILKGRYKELDSLIRENISQNFGTAKMHNEVDKAPLVKFHNVQKSNGNVNEIDSGSKLSKPQEVLHIFVYSREDGKPAIVDVAKDICTENLNIPKSKKVGGSMPKNLSSTSPHFDESTLDKHLNRHRHADLQTDPDLLIILGKVKSTLGFLPWHIRLTEIHWLPHLGRVGLSDIFQSLYKYSKCNQRFGT